MIDRVFKSWKTTTLGIGIIVASLVLVYLNRAELTEALAFITGGVGLIFAKDGKDKESNS